MPITTTLTEETEEMPVLQVAARVLGSNNCSKWEARRMAAFIVGQSDELRTAHQLRNSEKLDRIDIPGGDNG